MKSTLHLYFLACWMLVSHILNAQVKMEGAFTLGDTTQIHILTTTAGNVLEGRVIGFDREKVIFLWANDAVLTFPIAQVRSIRVKETPGSEHPPVNEKSAQEIEPLPHDFPNGDGFIYQASERHDKDIVARLESYSIGAFRFKTAKGQLEIINLSELIRLKLSSPTHEGELLQLEKLHVLYTKKRRDRFVGQVLYADRSILQFQIPSGAVMQLLMKDVESIRYEIVGKNLKDEIAMQTRSANGYDRLFVTPSGFCLPRGTHEYRNLDVFYNGFNFGVSDHFNAEIGLVPLLFFNAGHVNLKFAGALSEHLHIGVGVQGTGIYAVFNDPQHIGMFYGVATVGPKERYINLSVSRGDTNYSDPFTAFSVGGATKLVSKIRLVGEYIRISQPFAQTTVFNALLQIVGRNIRFEGGVMTLPGEELGIPLLGLHLQF